MKTIDASGDMCPIPVVKAKKALAEIKGGGLRIIVGNNAAVENLKRLAASEGCGFRFEKETGGLYSVIMEKAGTGAAEEKPEAQPVNGDIIAVISSNVMGMGDDALGKILMKGFIYALTQLDDLPRAIIFYNGGALLTTEGSESLEDIKALEEAGVDVMTCGTCLNHYKLSDRLKVGTVSNMYAIAEAMSKAGRVIKP